MYLLFSDKYQTLSPIPSSSSLSTIPNKLTSKSSIAPESNFVLFYKHETRNYKLNCIHIVHVLDSKLPRRNSFGYRTLKIIQKGISRKSFRSMTMQHQSSAADMFDMLAEQEMDRMSPLIRPKEFRHSFSINNSP